MCKILLIEDKHIEADILCEHLIQIDNNMYDDITIVDSENKFKEIIKTTKFDIILSDYLISTSFNGSDVIRYTQELNIEVPVIIVTGAIGEEKTAELLRIGAADLVLKDNVEKLHEVISRELKTVFYKVDQLYIMEKVNTILFKLAKAVKWIMQHDLKEISFQRILEDFGTLLSVDRSYIFQKINNVYTIKHMWCNYNSCNTQCDRSNIKCLSFQNNNEILQKIDNKENIYGLLRYFNLETQKDLLTNNIKSIICIPILNPNGEIWGFLGFDDCKQDRVWTKLEVNTLDLLSAIIGTIVYKIELKEVEDKIIEEQILLVRDAKNAILKHLGGD